MVVKKLYIKNDNFLNLIKKLRENYEVYIPEIKDEKLYFVRIKDNPLNSFNDIKVLSSIALYRTFEPLKNFFLKAREIVAEDFKNEVPNIDKKPYCIIGV